MEKNLRYEIEAVAKLHYSTSDPSHDFEHIKRVVATCLKLGEVENASMDVIIPAAYFHDVVNLPKNHPRRSEASTLAAEKAMKILAPFSLPMDALERIYQAIREHSFSSGLRPSSIESQILQDADRLDSLGAIGLMRVMSIGTQMKASFYHSETPFGGERPWQDKAYTIDHFFVKLFKLPELMNTRSGKLMAQQRVEFMNSFLDQLKNEIF